jgi:prepilin-type N-terminal cleavage/methylation domain-containing protein
MRTAPPSPPGRRARGFTLIETALAIVIVGVAVLALISAQAAFHAKNQWASRQSTATYLAGEIRELTWNLPRNDPVTGDLQWGPETQNEISFEDYDDLDDFDGAGDGLVFSADFIPPNGPVNARRQVIPNMAGWSQTVRVFNVAPDDITYDPDDPGAPGTVPADGTTAYMGVDVTVSYQGPRDADPMVMTHVSWVAPR